MKSAIVIAMMLSSLIGSLAFAEVPPPGTSRKGPIKVTPQGQSESEYDLSAYKVIPRADARKVQKKIDALRARIKDLENQLANRQSVPTPVQVPFERRVEVEKRVEVVTPHRSRIALYGGIAPDGVHIDSKDVTRKAEVHETGTAIGASYSYLFTERWSVNAFGSVTTRSTYIPSGYLGVGYDF